MRLLATRAAMWRWRLAQVRARPGCWSRVSCALCWMEHSRKKSWPSPLPSALRVKCANACSNGWLSFQRPAPKNWLRNWPCAASPRSRAHGQRQTWTLAWRSFMPACWPAAGRCKFAPSTAGLPPCCATRLFLCCNNWACPPTTSCWRTTTRPKPRCGGSFMQH